jgi:tetratricopeptide (TPR) repeat protein
LSRIRVAAAFLAGLLCLACALARADDQDLGALQRQAFERFQAGDYAQAERYARQALDATFTAYGEDSPSALLSLGNLIQVLVKLGRLPEAESLARRALDIAERGLGPEHPDTAAALNGLAAVYAAGGRYHDAEGLYRRAMAILETTVGPTSPDMATSAAGLAQQLHRRGRYAEAEPYYRLALSVAERLLGSDHPSTAAALHNFADSLREQGRYAEAEPLSRRALGILEAANGAEHPGNAPVIGSLALTLAAQGHFARAKAFNERALRILTRTHGAEHPATAAALSNFATSLRQEGRFADAEAAARRALAILERSLGDAHPDTLTALHGLGQTLRMLGRYTESEAAYRRALAAEERVLGPDHPNVASTCDSLAGLLNQEARYAEAEALYRRAVSILEQSLGRENPNTATSMHNLAILMRNQGRNDEAESAFYRVLGIWETVWGPNHPSVASTLNNLGLLLSRQRRYAEAEPLLRRSLAIRLQQLGAQHPDTALVVHNLGVALEAQSRFAEAEPLLRQAAAISGAGGEPWYRVLHHHGLGRFLAQRGRPEAALQSYRSAVDALDWLFAQTRGLSDEARYSFLGQFADIYREYIDLLLSLHQRSARTGYDREAFAAASRNQSRIFSELLRQSDVTRFSGEPAFLALKAARDGAIARLGALNASRSSLSFEAPDSAGARAEIEKQIQSAERDLARADASLRARYPRFMELVLPLPVTVDELQRRMLRAGEALLTFVLLSERVAVFAVSRERFKSATVPVSRQEVSRQIRGVRRAMDAAASDLFALESLDPETLHALYRSLFAPVEDVLRGADRIIVVADGPAYALPLEMLVTDFGDSVRRVFQQTREDAHSRRGALLAEYGVLPYLGDAYRFTYEPSLTGFASERLYPKPAGRMRQELIAFADPVFGEEGDAPGLGREDRAYSPSTRAALRLLSRSARRDARELLPRLPETAEETRSVASLMSGPVDVYLRDRAQERMLKSLDLTGARYLLFSTHGLLGGEFLPPPPDPASASAPGTQPDAGAQPALVLTLVGDLQGEDGFLTMKEVIEDVHLNAELVVLSACNTAGGAGLTGEGEGFAGLTRAFLYAGARRLLVSHWAVESAATRDLVVDMFRSLRAGQSAMSAAAAARNRLRATRSDAAMNADGPAVSRAHPFFWAPFVVVGD